MSSLNFNLAHQSWGTAGLIAHRDLLLRNCQLAPHGNEAPLRKPYVYRIQEFLLVFED